MASGMEGYSNRGDKKSNSGPSGRSYDVVRGQPKLPVEERQPRTREVGPHNPWDDSGPFANSAEASAFAQSQFFSPWDSNRPPSSGSGSVSEAQDRLAPREAGEGGHRGDRTGRSQESSLRQPRSGDRIERLLKPSSSESSHPIRRRSVGSTRPRGFQKEGVDASSAMARSRHEQLHSGNLDPLPPLLSRGVEPQWSVESTRPRGLPSGGETHSGYEQQRHQGEPVNIDPHLHTSSDQRWQAPNVPNYLSNTVSETRSSAPGGEQGASTGKKLVGKLWGTLKDGTAQAENKARYVGENIWEGMKVVGQSMGGNYSDLRQELRASPVEDPRPKLSRRKEQKLLSWKDSMVRQGNEHGFR